MSNKAHLTQVYSVQGNNRFLCMCSHDLQQHFNTSVSITASETLEHLKAVFTEDVLIPQKNNQNQLQRDGVHAAKDLSLCKDNSSSHSQIK